MGLLAVYIFSVMITVGFCEKSQPLVKTPLGFIRGYHDKSFNGRTFSSFQGIRYAQPPIGELRFKEPKPFGPWKGIWDAKTSSSCPQISYQTGDVTGDEDCLFINVYVPKEQPSPDDKFDVIVEIHGGGFMTGVAQDFLTPTNFMDRDVIMVSMNYRLNVLGFLSTEDDVLSGNLGLKDQTLALKWIQQNIASFGGNPDSVTIEGCSAGGTSVHLHYFSPLSKGLFHRGISHSGTALNVFALQQNPLDKAQRIARSLDCPDGPSKDLIECLSQIPVKNLVEKTTLLSSGCYGFSLTPFAPVIEKNQQNAFLDKHPYYKLMKNELVDLPWIASNVKDEGEILGLFPKEGMIDEIDEKWEGCAKYLMDYNYTLDESLHVGTAEKVKEFYLGKDKKFKDEGIDKLLQIIADRYFLVDGELAIRKQAEANKSPVYYYLFSYLGDHFKRSCHGCDLLYFFNNFYFNVTLTETEINMKDRLIDMAVSFAKTGKPDVGTEWKPTGYKQFTYLNISDPDQMGLLTVDEFSPMKFWHSIPFRENQNLFLPKDKIKFVS